MLKVTAALLAPSPNHKDRAEPTSSTIDPMALRVLLLRDVLYLLAASSPLLSIMNGGDESTNLTLLWSVLRKEARNRDTGGYGEAFLVTFKSQS